MKVINLLNKEDLEKILEHYDMREQLKYFQSEVFELNEAIIEREIQWNIGEAQNIVPYEKHIAEEIADVLVMLNQFVEYYGISRDYIDSIQRDKIDRQLERINKG